MTGPMPKPWIDAIAPYVPGRATDDSGRKLIKLSANENPLGTSASVIEAFEQGRGSLFAYPDPGATMLREAIGAKYDLDPSRIIYGTGSDEVLHLAAGAFAGLGDEVLYVRYGFSVYPIAARRVGAEPIEADDTDYATDIDALMARVNAKTRVIFLANPNNPTGTYSGRAEIARLHAAIPSDCLLVIDQAYGEYVAPEDDDGNAATRGRNQTTMWSARPSRCGSITRPFGGAWRASPNCSARPSISRITRATPTPSAPRS